MDGQRRRLLAYLGLVAAAVVAYTLVYDWGMGALEGRPRSLTRSLVVVVETFTTVGYGEDAPWSSPLMNLFMVAMQLSGVLLVLIALPLFVAPWVEDRLAGSVPDSTDASDHVVVCGVTPRTRTLAVELSNRSIPYTFLTPDAETGRELRAEGEPVVAGEFAAVEDLAAAGVERAAAVVLDAGDEHNAAAALSVRELSPERRIVALLEDPDRVAYLRYAGVDSVLSPRELLGRGLADKVTSSVTSDLDGTVEIGQHFEIAELPVQNGSPLEGVSLQESRVRERSGANVIGAWIDGEFLPNPPPSRPLERSTVLLVAGSADQLEAMRELTQSRRRGHGHDRVLVAGYGEVGRTVREIVDDAGLDTTVIDRSAAPGVDVVGAVDDEATLRDAAIEEASAMVLALPDDTATIFTVLVARQLAPDVELVCRANQTESVSKLYRAGADYVLSLDSVAGRMVAGAVLDEELLGIETGIEIVRTDAPDLAGQSLVEADVRSRTGCTVIAVERDGAVLTDLGPEFVLAADDALVVAGTDGAIVEFYEFAGATVSAAADD